ncbi:MAG TPA: ABC transporter substrate-binding protein [Acidimicrobiales bacterium]|nr:ABC transporter substrate-binding protein [Acidimicrobiales bacterium]
MPLSETHSRRDFLKLSGAAAGLLASGGALAACGGSAAAQKTGAGTAARPRPGGALRAAITGGTSSDTLDAQAPIQVVDFARVVQLYNSPVQFDLDGRPQLSLMEEITPNPTATEWVMRLRPGVTFHDGKTASADDVIFSFQRIMKLGLPGAPQMSLLDVQHLRKLDDRTVMFPFRSPFSPFVQVLCNYYYYIVPVGYDPKNPIGTGPFKYKSFTPGEESVFVKNENYWEAGLPYLDQVVITDFPDETSQINALLSGQVDVIDALSAQSVNSLRSQNVPVVIADGGQITPFTMRVDVAPFNDVRVRQAMRYIVDRPQMRELIFDGYGLLGNDLYAILDPDYDHSMPQRVQDIDMAKSLLAAAGHDGLQVQLVTSAINAGTVQAATVFAQQAKSAGVTVNLQQVTPTDFFGPNYLKWTFSQDEWESLYYLTMAGESSVPTAPFNENHFANPQFDSLYAQALATLNPTLQRELIHEMQTIEWNEGGYIIPYFTPFIDAHASKLHGVQPGKELPLSNFEFKYFWFD